MRGGSTFDADVQRVEPEVLQRLDQHCALDARAGVVELHFGLDVHAEIAVLRTGVSHNNYNDHNWKSQQKHGKGRGLAGSIKVKAGDAFKERI